MKHLYLTALLAAAGLLSAGAEQVVKNHAVYEPDAAIQSVSPNGEWAAGYNVNNSGVAVYNLVTGESWIVNADATQGCELGYGNVVADDGSVPVMVGTVQEDGAVVDERMVVFRQGETVSLRQGVWADAISPNGQYVVGYTSQGKPVIWSRKDDGTFGTPTALPAPVVDVFGLTAQYTHAMGVNDEGTLVTCTTCPGTGLIDSNAPGVFRKGDDGKWTYDCISKDVITTDLERPEVPSQIAPEPEDYMDADKRAEWLALYEAWEADTAHNEYPNPEDFMTEEQIAAYEEAWRKSFEDDEKAMEEYMEKLEEYEKATQDLAFFWPNDCVTSPACTYMAATGTLVEFEGEERSEHTYVYVWNLATREWTRFNVDDVAGAKCTFISDDGKMSIVSQNLYYGSSYVTTDIDTMAPQPLYSWMETRNEETYMFMEDNMYYPAVRIMPDGDPTEMIWNCGFYHSNADLTVLAGFVFNLYDYYEDPETGMDYTSNNYINYVLNATPVAGIADIEADVRPQDAPAYYTLQGVRVASPEPGSFYVKVQGGKASKVIL